MKKSLFEEAYTYLTKSERDKCKPNYSQGC